ncbi:MAG: hypothetical protein IPM23_19390 [Candidatus Melainabacteria bacterium]|nr:hypothetical protein [Candidatus Melainabacteria bacterium]
MTVRLSTHYRMLFLVLVSALGCLYAAKADEIPSTRGKTIPDAVEGSDVIVIALFKKIEDEKSTYTYYSPPVGYFEVLETLKGKTGSNSLAAYLEFGIRNEPKPTAWKYERSSLPEEGSKWILFFPSVYPNLINSTYAGSFGRVRHSQENQRMIERILDLKKSVEGRKSLHRR